MIRVFKFKSQYITRRDGWGDLVRASYTLPGVIEITNRNEPNFHGDGDPVLIEVTPLMKDIFNNADRLPDIGYWMGCSELGIYKDRLYIYTVGSFFVLWNKEMKLKDWKHSADMDLWYRLTEILEVNKIKDIRIKEIKGGR